MRVPKLGKYHIEIKYKHITWLIVFVVGFLISSWSGWYATLSQGGLFHILTTEIISLIGLSDPVPIYLLLSGLYFGLLVPWCVDYYRKKIGWTVLVISFVTWLLFFWNSPFFPRANIVVNLVLVAFGGVVGVQLGGVSLIQRILRRKDSLIDEKKSERKYNRSLLGFGIMTSLLSVVGLGELVRGHGVGFARTVTYFVGLVLITLVFIWFKPLNITNKKKRTIIIGPERSGKTSTIWGLWRSADKNNRGGKSDHFRHIDNQMYKGAFPKRTKKDQLKQASFWYIQKVGILNKKIELLTIDYPGEALTAGKTASGLSNVLKNTDEPETDWREIIHSLSETDPDRELATIRRYLAQLLHIADTVVFVLPADDFIGSRLKYKDPDYTEDSTDDKDYKECDIENGGKEQVSTNKTVPDYHKDNVWMIRKKSDIQNEYLLFPPGCDQDSYAYKIELNDGKIRPIDSENKIELDNDKIKYINSSPDTRNAETVTADIDKWRGVGVRKSGSGMSDNIPAYYIRGDFENPRTHPSDYLNEYQELKDYVDDSIWVVTMADLYQLDKNNKPWNIQDELTDNHNLPRRVGNYSIDDWIDQHDRLYSVWYEIEDEDPLRFNTDTAGDTKKGPLYGSKDLRKRIAEGKTM